MRRKHPKDYFGVINYRSEKFYRYEDGSVDLPGGKVLDAETKTVRRPLLGRGKRK